MIVKASAEPRAVRKVRGKAFVTRDVRLQLLVAATAASLVEAPIFVCLYAEY